MKRPIIATSLLSLGVGAALGALFELELHKHAFSFESADNEASHIAGSAPVNSQIDQTIASIPADSGQDAMSVLFNDTNSFRKTEGIVDYVKSVPIEQIPEALLEIQRHSGDGQEQARNLLIARWVDADPKGAEEAIQKTEDGQVRYLLSREVFTALAARDVPAAMAQAQQLPTQGQRDEAILHVINEAAKRDPAQALTLFQHAQSFYGGALNAVFTNWADQNLSQASDAIGKLPRANDRSSAIQTVSIHLAEKDPQAALAWVEQLSPGEDQDTARENIIARLANRDPKSAADYVRGLQQVPADVKIDLVQNVAMYWSQTNPKAAAQWAITLPPSQARNVALQVSLNYWARNDPRAAVDFMNGLPIQAMGRTSMLQGLASTWASTDPQGALAWVNQMPAGTEKDGAFRSAIGQWAGTDPIKAAAYVQGLPDDKIRPDLISQVAGYWAGDDPASAALWIAHFPDTSSKTELYTNLVRTWAKSNPVDASTWLGQLPAGATRDATVRSFSEQIAGGDPASALQWAESIGEANARQDEVVSVLQRWQSFDPVGAKAAVGKSSLSQEQKNRLLQQGR